MQDIEADIDGETYKLDVRLEDKDNLRHVAHYPIKKGPRTYKSVNVFEIKASSTGKKIINFWKGKERKDNVIDVNEDAKLNLQPDEVERLATVLEKLEEDFDLEKGEYVFLKKDSPSMEAAIDAVDSVKNTESDHLADMVIKLLESAGNLESEVDDLSLSSEDISEDLLDAENLVKYARTKNQLNQFKEMVDSEKSEYTYQKFLENNPWIFGTRYVESREERELTRDEEVDFCLESVNGYFDIFEIKRPDHTVMVQDSSHDTYYASSDLSKAVSQVENYIKEIENARDEILRRDGLDILKPRGCVVIGSNLTDEEAEGLQIYNSYLNRIRVLTYDNLVSMGERLVDLYQSSND